MLIFVLQSIWLYISELAGKDLALNVILKFLLYVTPTLIPLILPLTILLASIMVFGQFAENYEFAAMKSTGISLQRAMRGLSIFIVLLSLTTFIFSNNVIPWANYNFYNLRKNIAKVQPAMAIAEGQFNDIGEYNIKVEEKSGEKGEFLKNVVIHKKGMKRSGNTTVIISETGELKSNENSNILQLVLYEGHYYEEIFSKDPKKRIKKPHAKSYFEEYTINVDLEGLNDVDIDDKSYDNRYNMLNVSSLNYTIDSLYVKKSESYKDFSKTLYNRTSFAILSENIEPQKDSIFNGNILSLFNNKTKVQLLGLAKNTTSSSMQILTANKKNFAGATKWLSKHVISLHEKYVLAFACIILFFVGAPLGALIRKGGIGLPLVIAILLFLTYHFIGIFAKNSSLDGTLNPVLATWLSTLIMLPLSVYLTKRATKDRGLFETDGVFEPLKKLFGIKKEEQVDHSLLPIDSDMYQMLNNYDNSDLIDVLKNYRRYNYTVAHKNTSLSILKSRGITEQELKFSGNLADYKFEETLRLKKLYVENSKLAFILYFITLVLTLSGAILRNNEFGTIGNILFFAGNAIGILFLFSFIKAFLDFTNLYKNLGKNNILHAIIIVIFGIPIYFLVYFFQIKQINKDLNLSSAKKTVKVNKSELNLNKTELDKITNNYSNLKFNSNMSMLFYILALGLFISYFILKNNELIEIALPALELSVISLILYLFYVIKTYINTITLKKLLLFKYQILSQVITFIIYPLFHYTTINKINDAVSYTKE